MRLLKNALAVSRKATLNHWHYLKRLGNHLKTNTNGWKIGIRRSSHVPVNNSVYQQETLKRPVFSQLWSKRISKRTFRFIFLMSLFSTIGAGLYITNKQNEIKKLYEDLEDFLTQFEQILKKINDDEFLTANTLKELSAKLNFLPIDMSQMVHYTVFLLNAILYLDSHHTTHGIHQTILNNAKELNLSHEQHEMIQFMIGLIYLGKKEHKQSRMVWDHIEDPKLKYLCEKLSRFKGLDFDADEYYKIKAMLNDICLSQPLLTQSENNKWIEIINKEFKFFNDPFEVFLFKCILGHFNHVQASNELLADLKKSSKTKKSFFARLIPSSGTNLDYYLITLDVLGKKSYSNGNYSKAAQYCQEILKIDPNNFFATLAQHNIDLNLKLKMGGVDKKVLKENAVKIYDHLLSQALNDEQTAHIYLHYGDMFSQFNDFYRARNCYYHSHIHAVNIYDNPRRALIKWAQVSSQMDVISLIGKKHIELDYAEQILIEHIQDPTNKLALVKLQSNRNERNIMFDWILEDNSVTDYEYALLSRAVYTNDCEDSELKKRYWKLLRNSTQENLTADSFYAAAFVNDVKKEIVIAYRGTEKLNISVNLIQFLKSVFVRDLNGVLGSINSQHLGDYEADVKLMFDRIHSQHGQAYAFFNSILDYASKQGKTEYTVSLTGHSLGASLAEIVVWLTKNDTVKPSAITFDSPGSKQLIENMERVPSCQLALSNMKVRTYLRNPNLINTCKDHVGQVFVLADTRPIAVEPEPPKSFWNFIFGVKKLAVRTLDEHGINNIITFFNPDSGFPNQDAISEVITWPRGLYDLAVVQSMLYDRNANSPNQITFRPENAVMLHYDAHFKIKGFNSKVGHKKDFDEEVWETLKDTKESQDKFPREVALSYAIDGDNIYVHSKYPMHQFNAFTTKRILQNQTPASLGRYRNL